ncbi:MAG: ATP-binding cassette domain-containing protein [Burkholderiales bacterium]|nr:ATP-binding cassette domain-containing protein [Burkholderiales bacterium]
MENAPVLIADQINKVFKTKGKTVEALKSVSLDLREGETLAIVGPDGAGKTTLLRILAGLLNATKGKVDVKVQSDSERINVIGYMPQKFGLYEDLSVQENLDLFADLSNMSQEARANRFSVLLGMASMAPFTQRLAGDLSGGMKQKLGLICTLINPPKILLLDEPTVGVDPFSRKELWSILQKLTSMSHMSVIVTTPYLDEAQECDRVLVLHDGEVIKSGTPKDIIALTQGMTWLIDMPQGVKPRVMQSKLLHFPGCINAVPQGGGVRFVHPDLQAHLTEFKKITGDAQYQPIPSNLEDSVMFLLTRDKEYTPINAESKIFEKHVIELDAEGKSPIIIQTKNVYKKFGNFIAVNDVSFTVRKGEVFGLLGPNGAGKTTTFKMLCGLSKPTSGTLTVNGMNSSKAPRKIRQELGYVAQKFSLYDELTVQENLDFYAGAYGLAGKKKEARQKVIMAEFSLEKDKDRQTRDLPGGFKRRLTMAAALQHSPDILFLDEPTSGADPLARREFWQRITRFSEQGVTVIVTTHFMEEAEYCDHLIIQDAGKMFSMCAPGEFREYAVTAECPHPTMEDAFVAIVSEFRKEESKDVA